MEIKEFLKALTTDPRARELLKGLKEPKDIKEAAGKYLEIAKELGISLSEKGLEAFLQLREKAQKAKTEQAGESVKEALGEDGLGSAAGGADYEGYQESCADTYLFGEGCLVASTCASAVSNGGSGNAESSCVMVINYNDPNNGDDNQIIDG